MAQCLSTQIVFWSIMYYDMLRSRCRLLEWEGWLSKLGFRVSVFPDAVSSLSLRSYQGTPRIAQRSSNTLIDDENPSGTMNAAKFSQCLDIEGHMRSVQYFYTTQWLKASSARQSSRPQLADHTDVSRACYYGLRGRDIFKVPDELYLSSTLAAKMLSSLLTSLWTR